MFHRKLQYDGLDSMTYASTGAREALLPVFDLRYLQPQGHGLGSLRRVFHPKLFELRHVPGSRPKGIAWLGIREWTCTECAEHHDRDVNAGRNILAAGHRRLAVGIPVL
ncbi:MAG: zinc ribbon domain-containing protein [Pseudomonas sp.]